MSDLELVERASRGDERAFRTLYDDNVDRIYRLVHRMVGDSDLARELTQEAFVRVYQKLGQFRGEAAFSTWAHRIAVRVTLNGLRRRARHRDRERDLESADNHAVGQSPAEPGLRDRIASAVDALPDIYRTVFLMHDLEGYSHGEIAESLGVAEGTSKARLFRARSRLRHALGDAMQEYVT
ncbi:MAG TPA: sigma-70 family RNA polymerase sigma factor [Longimicrobiales bacterium]|nr:sigma-70 family RNA polymerase sigma factor [Longimicrobiales bacterium]